ncbi:hypothetical protein CEXT_339731 [Caerostris extrusa]|uniref:Uncharacterized protein n=1 Tax=Caerostris extrusa TaxID=172846 RepID=A0AAV4PTC8_CAEEX|nr:hypothetical protein CEXT_339731 [Caerostris extrusa]
MITYEWANHSSHIYFPNPQKRSHCTKDDMVNLLFPRKSKKAFPNILDYFEMPYLKALTDLQKIETVPPYSLASSSAGSFLESPHDPVFVSYQIPLRSLNI